jgi:uncharacterized LabA/DUF88 family protein
MIADDLRRQADHFIDLVTLRKDIGRDASERNERPQAAAQSNDEDFEDDDY